MNGTSGRNRARGGTGTDSHGPGGGPRIAEHELVRLVHGELAPGRAEEIRRRAEAEPELARRIGRLEAAWNGLELPPAEPAPPGFAARVAARARAEGRDDATAFRPAWVRAVAAAALTVGIGAGAALGGLALPDAVPGAPAGATDGAATVAEGSAGTNGAIGAAGTGDADDSFSLDAVPTLAESYWTAVAPDGTTLEELR